MTGMVRGVVIDGFGLWLLLFDAVVSEWNQGRAIARPHVQN